MSLLISHDALAARRETARGPLGPLAPLAESLLRDLQPLLDASFEIPTAKALLSRDGGRCPQHGVPLEFDPYRPHEHRCPVDGEIFRGERHDRWWVMWYQLWLAERAVHAAALHGLTGEPAVLSLATRILDGYARQYLRYPNRDNVLGPTRPFFSTYLESIWLLQLCVALDLLEVNESAGALSGVVRDQVIQPSAALIASYDEGGSNRQVWNSAAILAATLLLHDRSGAERAAVGRSGVLAQIEGGLLPDGTWYEGENYHFFAHRGLWYGVTMMERAGLEISSDLVARFNEGFAAPLATALPDFTFPSRRDSQYGISLRQWRFAESCELGLARGDDRRLVGALWELYQHGGAPQCDTGRWRSTAEAERNEPPSALTRADLGWRSLLLARDVLPPLEPVPARSALLEGQGIAVLRRDAGATYLALDYGHSGGGHGHPDRLNVLLAHGTDRWLDDMGTGSYVDPTLHWYRSTLAHNAPLVNGHSQQRVSGVLRAFEEQDGAGWVSAEVPAGAIAPGVRVRRSLAAMRDYAVDRIEWESEESITFDLPLHVAAAVHGVSDFRDAPLEGGAGLEDGFGFVHDSAVATAPAGANVTLGYEGRTIAWVSASTDSEWWRAVAPGAPGKGEREFLLVRSRGQRGVLTTVWSWGAEIARVAVAEGRMSVELAGAVCHEHVPGDATWRVERNERGACSHVELGGARPAMPAKAAAAPRQSLSRAREPEIVPRAPAPALAYELASDSYRMSEESWPEAGCPQATVSLRVEGRDLVVHVDVRKSPIVFRSADAPDPMLDNEHPDIHSDGVQLHLAASDWPTPAAWLAIPEGDGGVRARHVEGARTDVPLTATWHATPAGYTMRLAIPLDALGDHHASPLGIQVVVNDMAPGRERRRGQLVLSGGAGEFIYLRGDRESPEHFRQFLLPRV